MSEAELREQIHNVVCAYDEHGWERIEQTDKIIQLFQAEKDALLDTIIGGLPETATETKSLGKDYSGYARGFNEALIKVTQLLQQHKGGGDE